MKRSNLPVRLLASFVCFAEIKIQLVAAFFTQLLHYVERPFAQRLTHRVKEHEHQICLLSCSGKVTGKRKRKIWRLE